MNAEERNDDDHPVINTGGGAYIIGTVNTGGGDFVGRDKITVYQGPVYPQFNYRSDITAILAFYTQTFVGREREWANLTHFVCQATPSYRLVEAPAGYGKSALLAQIIHRHETDQWTGSPSPYLLYFFIRQEGQHHTPEMFLQALNSQLLTLLNLPGGVPPDLSSLRGQFSQLWLQALSLAGPEQPLLLLLDGLDEQASGDVTIAHLLPANLASYVHIVVSSRPNPEPLLQTTLEHPFRQASVLRLQTFSEGEVQQLLQESGVDSTVATRLAPRVLTLTQGEPLFARFACQEVAAEGEVALSHLEQNPPADVEAYFRQQFRQLDTLAQGELTWQILGLLTVTLSGITVEEIAEVLEVGKRSARKAIEPIQRFLLGRPRLELMHVQLRKVVVEEFSPVQRQEFHEKILHWGHHYAAQGWPTETLDYLLAHYAQHLVEAGQREALYALINNRWMDLKFERTFSHRAFANDVELAIKVAGAEEPPNLVQVIRDCLISATLRELATNVPPEILGVLAQVGQVDTALDYVSLVQEVQKKIEANRLIGQTLLSRGDLVAARRVYVQTLEIAVDTEDDGLKAKTLRSIAPSLVQVGAVDQALQVAAEIEDEEQKARALNGIAEALAQTGAVDQALQVVAEIEDEEQKARALNGIAEALAQTGAVDQALQVVSEIEDEEQKAGALRGITLALAQTGAVDQALQVVAEIEDEEQKVGALSGIAKVLVQAGAVEHALGVVARIGDKGQKAVALRDIAMALAQAGAVEQALKVADEIEVEWYKAEALMKGITGALARTGAVEQALQVADGIKHERQKVWALRGITLALARTGAVEQALQVVAGIEKEVDKALMLEEIAHILAQAGVVEQALKVADEIEVESFKAGALRGIAQELAQAGVVEQALKVIDEIEDEGHKAWALKDVAQALAQAGVLEQALKVANKIEDEGHKAWALKDVAQALVQVGSVEQALKMMVAGIEDEGYKMEALKGIAEALAQTGMVEQALQVATKIEIGAERQKPEEAWALEGWAAWFEAEMQKKAALRDITQALAQTGRTAEAHSIWRDIFISTILIGRKRVFTILQHSAPALAALDHGKTLWQIYEAVMEVESWWKK